MLAAAVVVCLFTIATTRTLATCSAATRTSLDCCLDIIALIFRVIRRGPASLKRVRSCETQSPQFGAYVGCWVGSKGSCASCNVLACRQSRMQSARTAIGRLEGSERRSVRRVRSANQRGGKRDLCDRLSLASLLAASQSALAWHNLLLLRAWCLRR